MMNVADTIISNICQQEETPANDSDVPQGQSSDTHITQYPPRKSQTLHYKSTPNSPNYSKISPKSCPKKEKVYTPKQTSKKLFNTHPKRKLSDTSGKCPDKKIPKQIPRIEHLNNLYCMSQIKFNCENRLLILDLGDVLCKRVSKKENGKWSNIPPDVKLPSYNVVFRHGYKEFLQHCYTHYDVGYYTSGIRENAEMILDHMLTKQQRNITKFVLTRDNTYIDWERIHKFNTQNSVKSPSSVKSCFTNKLLDVVLYNPTINYPFKYNMYNVIICDDDPEKVRYINPVNVIIVDKIHDYETDIELNLLIPKIELQFSELKQLWLNNTS